MRRVFGLLLLPLMLVATAWLAAVIYFQQSGHDIDANGILRWFVLLPLAVVLAWFALRLGYRTLRRSRQNTPDESASAAPAAAAAPAEDPSLRLSLGIVAAALHTPAGADPSQLLAGIRKGDVAPALSDSEFDRDGLPVKLSADPSLDTAAAAEWVARQLASHPVADASPDEAARLIAMLASPLAEAIDVIAQLPPLPPADTRSTPSTAPQEAPRRPLITKLFVPAAWQELVAAYVREQLAPLTHLAFGIVRADPQNPEPQRDAIRVADAFCASSDSTHAQAALLIVACDSLTSSAQIAALESRELLFAAHNQLGRVPGEAAAVVVAVPAALAGEALPPLARLHRAASGTRQKPVDASGRIDANDMQQFSTLTLTHAGQAPEQVCALVTDCDHRGNWLLESAMLMGAQFPDLDPVADHIATGNALGHVGHAHATLALALAAHHVANESQPVLVASTADVQARSLATLTPWTQASPAAT